MKKLFLIFCCAFVFGNPAVKAQVRTGFIKAGGYDVYYETKGKGKPVIFVHAGLQDHKMWDLQVEELSKTFQVISLDLPYHGLTKGDDTLFFAKDVIRILLDGMKLEKISIVGLSMGAAVTQDFIIAYPDRVSKAVLISSGINGYEKYFKLDSLTMNWASSFFGKLKERDTAGAAMVFARTWRDGITMRDTGLVKDVSKKVFETTLQTLRAHKALNWPKLENNPPAMDKLDKIKIPLLIIHGDQDLPFIEVASKYLEKAIDGSKRIEFKNAAHMLNLEKPQELNQALFNFL